MIRFAFVAAWLLLNFAAEAQTCPPEAKSCKVIVVTPEQENVLDQLITQTCIQGPYAQINDVVKFYKDMLAKAPAGKVAEPAKKPEVK